MSTSLPYAVLLDGGTVSEHSDYESAVEALEWATGQGLRSTRFQIVHRQPTTEEANDASAHT